MSRYVGLLTAVLILTLHSAATAKESDDRIGDLERHISTLEKTYMTNNQDVASAVSQIQTFQAEFSGVKGEVEAVSHQLQSQHEEMMRLISDLQARVQSIEEGMGTFSSQVASGTGKTNPAAGAEAESYQKALALANSSKYLEAAAAFTAFVDKYPKSQSTPNARFWIGECFYSARDYKRAIKEFQNFIEKSPKNQKIPEAVFKQGSSFYELGLLDEARAFFEKIVTSYPQSTEAAKAKAKLSRIDERKSGKTPNTSKPAAGYEPQPPTSSQGSYPTETIEQQRQKMSGGSAEPVPMKEETQRKTGLPPKEF